MFDLLSGRFIFVQFTRFLSRLHFSSHSLGVQIVVTRALLLALANWRVLFDPTDNWVGLLLVRFCIHVKVFSWRKTLFARWSKLLIFDVWGKFAGSANAAFGRLSLVLLLGALLASFWNGRFGWMKRIVGIAWSNPLDACVINWQLNNLLSDAFTATSSLDLRVGSCRCSAFLAWLDFAFFLGWIVGTLFRLLYFFHFVILINRLTKTLG